MSFALRVLEPAATFSYDDLVTRLKLPGLHEPAPSGNGGWLRGDNAPPDPYRVCSDGQRTKHLTRLAGMWLRQGKEIEEVTHLCLGWNAENTPPLKDGKIVSTVENIARTHARNHSEAARKALTPLFDLESARAARFAGLPPKRQYILGGFLPLGKVGMVAAPGGTGKSMLLLQLAMAVATGRDLFMWKVTSPGSVLMLAGEDDDIELHNRVFAIAGAMGYGAAEWQLLDAHLYVKSMVAENNLMTSSERGGETKATDYVGRLLLVAQQIGDLKVIIIDPASRFRGGDENTAQDATRFVEQLERLAQETGATVIALHHVSKAKSGASEQTQDAARGSSAFSDGVRWQLNLRTPTKAEATSLQIPEDTRKRHLIVANTKNNYGPMAEDVVLTRTDGGVLVVVQLGLKGPSIEGLLYDFVEAEAAAGRSHTANQVEAAWGGREGRFGVGKVKLRRYIAAAIAKGYLRRNEKRKLVPGEKGGYVA